MEKKRRHRVINPMFPYVTGVILTLLLFEQLGDQRLWTLSSPQSLSYPKDS